MNETFNSDFDSDAMNEAKQIDVYHGHTCSNDPWPLLKSRTECSVIFQLFILNFRFRVRDREIEVFGFRAGYSMASRRRVRKRTEQNSPFRSVPGFSSHLTLHDIVQLVSL